MRAPEMRMISAQRVASAGMRAANSTGVEVSTSAPCLRKVSRNSGIGRSLRHGFHTRVAARARARLDYDGLTEQRREMLREHPGQDVDAAAGRKWNDDSDRLARPGLLSADVTTCGAVRCSADAGCDAS
ncbi:MAG TPA: hypothetical protein VNG69_03325 [Casimicrobiaceae bacterium]|nr:hypothetical protein [Casimicrobiaceae bacterium]